MNAKLRQPTSSGSPSVRETLNHNQNSFNATSSHIHNHTHYHQYSHSRYGRSSFNPTLASVASDDSSTATIPISDQVEGRRANHAARTFALNAEDNFPHASASPDGIAVAREGGNVQDREHGMPLALKSGTSFRRASASHVTHTGSVKRRSIFSTVRSLSTRILGFGGRKAKYQPPKPEKLQLWTEFNIEEVDGYLPEGMVNYMNYMRSRHLGQTNAIPIWNPSPIMGVNVRKRRRIDVGDVGTFTRRGGFKVAFNILMSEKTNKSCGYLNLPHNFSSFDPPLTPEQEEGCSVKDDGFVIDLDDSGAIVSEEINCPGALSYGFTSRRREPSEPYTTQLDVSPDSRKKDKRRGYVHLPHGAKVYSLNSMATDDLASYLIEHLPDWLEFLDRLWNREQAPPMILTAVWAARSFACATYNVHPPNTSAVAQVRTAGDKIDWAQESEGFATTRAPLDEGYDRNGKLKSHVEDQCFAIEGYVLKSRKEVSKLRASLITI